MLARQACDENPVLSLKARGRAGKLEAKGKPVEFKQLLRMERDGGTTNIRNVKSKHGPPGRSPQAAAAAAGRGAADRCPRRQGRFSRVDDVTSKTAARFGRKLSALGH